MLIDWFTVAAQAVNFLILAWLLKRFLYGPIIKAMDERRERLADEMASARQKRQEADQRATEMKEKQDELERESAAMLDKARSKADERREQWLEEARNEVEKRSREWMEALERERAGMSERLRKRMAEQVVHLAEKVLRDLAGEDLEARALNAFAERLARTDLEAPLRGQVEVRTGFPLSDETVRRFEEQMKAQFPEYSGLETDRDDSLGFGIVMMANDAKWEWNLASYLDDVEEAVFADLSRTKVET